MPKEWINEKKKIKDINVRLDEDLYLKLKTLPNKSISEFIRAAVEEKLNAREKTS